MCAAQRCGFDPAWRFIDAVRSSPRLQVVALEEIDVEATYVLLRRHDDHDFSFVDAASFVAMRERKLTHAFAFDRHFRSAGFVAV